MKRTVLLTFLLAAAPLLLVPGSSPAAGCPDWKTRPTPTTISPERVEVSIVCLINKQRTDYDLPPLRTNPILKATARGHSTSMALNGFFSHDSIDGTPVTTRILNAGYVPAGRAWMVGENIAWGSFAQVRGLVAAWMKSPAHRAAILEPRYREVGIGSTWGAPLYRGQSPAVVATADFGFVDRGGRSGAKAKKTLKH